MSKVIAAGAVNLIHPDTVELVTLVEGDVVPEWAEPLITNPALIADAPSPAEPPAAPAPDPTAASTTTTTTTTAPPAVDGTVAELREQAKALGIAQGGSKADLISRITAKLAADAEAAASTGAATNAAPDADATSAATDPAGADAGDERAALIARAEALDITVDPEWTDEELKALVEDAED